MITKSIWATWEMKYYFKMENKEWHEKAKKENIIRIRKMKDNKNVLHFRAHPSGDIVWQYVQKHPSTNTTYNNHIHFMEIWKNMVDLGHQNHILFCF